jgi:hypothetical protein
MHAYIADDKESSITICTLDSYGKFEIDLLTYHNANFAL